MIGGDNHDNGDDDDGDDLVVLAMGTLMMRMTIWMRIMLRIPMRVRMQILLLSPLRHDDDEDDGDQHTISV